MEFQELIQDAPNFVSMERGELVAYAYGMFAAGKKADAENAKLRNEVDNLLDFEHLTSIAVNYAGCDECGEYKQTMLRLFAENAKLRELCSDLRFCKRNNCLTCNHGRFCDMHFDERYAELGMEVK